MTSEERIRDLELQNHLLRAEVTRLAKLAGERSKHARRVTRAYNDAILLAGLRAGGQRTSRPHMVEEHGFTQNRWENACALLRLARVLTRHRHWRTLDLERIGSALEDARLVAMEQPTAFRARLNRHARGATTNGFALQLPA